MSDPKPLSEADVARFEDPGRRDTFDSGTLASAVATIRLLQRERDTARRELEEVVAVMQAVEWSGLTGKWESDTPACPSCKGMKPDEYDQELEYEKRRESEGLTGLGSVAEWAHRGHRDDCALAAWLSARRSR